MEKNIIDIFIDIFYRPEYIVLTISMIAICINVYIAWRNRKYALAKEEYFKLKQIAEKIIAKLIVLESHREKLKLFFEKSLEASKTNKYVLDLNDTFNKADFEKDSEEIAAFIEIYFNNLGKDWNLCLSCMGKLFISTFLLKTKIDKAKDVDWKKESLVFNEVSKELGNKPQQISDKIKEELAKFRKKNL